MKLSVIIPVLNEERTIREIIKKISSVSLGVDKEIIVVNDGSTDNTAKILEEIKNEYGLVLLAHSKNQGKGSAIRTGIAKATGDLVIIQDADLEYNPEDYNKLLKPFLENNAEVVYGSRILGSDKRGGIFFYLGGRVLTVMANLLYNLKITDEPTCYKVFKRSLLNSLNLESKGFEFCPEVTAKIGKKKIKIYEVPISYHPRGAAEGKKIKLKDGILAVWTLIKYKFHN